MQASHIDRREMVAGGLATAAAAVTPGCRSASGKPANILVIIADDMRWDCLGAMNNRVIHTPHLDALAARGVLFRNAYVTTSICAVSRASIFTGQYARRHGVWSFNQALSPALEEQTYFARLRDSHFTGLVGKWGIGQSVPKHLFDVCSCVTEYPGYFSEPGRVGRHLTDEQTGLAIEFLDRARAEPRPFLLTLCYKAPHAVDGADPEFQASRDLDDLYANVTIPRPATATEEHFERLPAFLKESEGRIRWRRRFATDEAAQETVRQYYRLISGVDASVGAVLKHLADQGQLDSTLIVFTSDNGMMLGEHGLTDKWWMYEESIHVPLIIAPPKDGGFAGGRTVDTFALNIDIQPTVLEAAGQPVPVATQGASLLPYLRPEPPAGRTEFFYEHLVDFPTIPKSEGVRRGPVKYIKWDVQQDGNEMLFDLSTDPFEERDLSKDPAHAPLKSELHALLDSMGRSLA